MGRLYLVTGGSASGKSECAENLASSLRSNDHGADPLRLYYIAAMYPYDDESRERVKRHRMLRNGKGFETIECHTGISRLENKLPGNSIVMLECMSNLLANSDHVIRVVCSIPINIKGAEPFYPQGKLTRQKRNEDI